MKGEKEGVEMEPRTALNIVLLPDQTVFNRALSLSYNITRKLKHEFVLDNERFRPHITLYQGYYPDRNIDSLIFSLEESCKGSKPVQVEMNDFQVSHGTFLFWNCEKTQDLQALHERVLQTANPFREGLIPPVTKDLMPSLTPKELEMVESTGGILNKDLFSPHITLTRLSHPPTPLETDLIQSIIGAGEKASFKPQSITVAYLGEHGTISDVLYEIPLG